SLSPPLSLSISLSLSLSPNLQSLLSSMQTHTLRSSPTCTRFHLPLPQISGLSDRPLTTTPSAISNTFLSVCPTVSPSLCLSLSLSLSLSLCLSLSVSAQR